ncbi:GntR family transcriptional regulator [Streptacidiphilus sp. MAP5-3]|uniref:GntR family transcriptional regulator n=1 Tax=unclassified Streptacidiphilus TaxID=2643834 RepID=UPI003516B57D
MLTYPTDTAVTARTISRDLKEKIRAGHPAPGLDLPSERDLAGAYQVTRQTVRAAVSLLQNEGWVQRDRLGTFVLKRAPGTVHRVADERDFPGRLLRAEAVVDTAVSGTLREALLPEEPAQDLGAAPGVTTLVHDHRVHGPHGEILQNTRTYLAPDLPEVLPQLSTLRSALRMMWTQHWPSGLGEPSTTGELGIGVDLVDLYRWLRGQGRVVRFLDQAPRSSSHPGTITVLRHIVDDDGHSLARSSMTVATGNADPSTLAHGAHPTSENRQSPPFSYSLSPQDRSWLEAWTLSRPAERGLALRARIVLLGETRSPHAVSAALGISPRVVCAWLDRFRAGGLPALRAQSRRGRPRRTEPAARDSGLDRRPAT